MYAAGGDDKTYSLLENVFAFASSAMIPIGTAGKAGELTFRSGIVMLGKEGVSTLAGYGASNLVYDKTNNQTLGMIAGIMASMGTAKGLNMADAKLGWSNKGVKGNVVESVTGDIESGLNSNLLDELDNSGVKYNPEDIVAITKTADGKLVWLENGTDTAGLNHIITEHADDFLNKGITQEQIPDYVMNALENGKIVGYQGRGTGRPIYEFTYNGEIHKVAITVGNNGFIVGANPK